MSFFVHAGRRARYRRAWVAAVLTALAGMPAGAGERLQLRIGDQVLRVEIAATPAQRTQGLMGRAPLKADEGMLFVFPGDDIRCLWMRDTPSALAAAFVTANGVILNLAEMQPQTDTRHCSRAPARYALETATGWFSQRSVAAGAKIQGLDAVPPALR